MEQQDINNIEEEINTIFNNLMLKGNLELNKLNSENYTKGIIFLINKFIDEFINLNSFKRNRIWRNIIFLSNKFKNNSLNIDFGYKLLDKIIIKRIILLIYILIYKYQIWIMNKANIDSSDKYLVIKRLYNLINKISPILSKLYINNIIELSELEVILKMLIIFTMNDNYENINENTDIKNLLYFKECLNILQIIFNKESSEEEQIFLVNIFNYINSNFCFRDSDNKIRNYTNKFYLLRNDYKTTQLVKLFNFIYEINNKNLTKIFFEFLINIYYFQFSYNNLVWQIYELIQPLLENIKEKDYDTLLNEVSFADFQFNFIKELFSKERNFIKDNIFIFKNAFYFSGKQQTSGIIANIGQIQDSFLLSFGFNLVITEEIKQEYIIFQIKNYDQKLQLKASIIKNNDEEYHLYIIDSSQNDFGQCWKYKVKPNRYYSFVMVVEKGKNINISYYRDSNYFEEKFVIKSMKTSNLLLTVGCNVKKIDTKSNSIHNNYEIINSYTGFIGDIFIINLHSYKDKFSIQKNILNLKGKYGYTLVKSLWEQKSLDEHVTSNLEKTTNIKSETEEEPSIFKKMLTSKEKYKLIDNIVLYVSSSNFRLIEYLDNIDYMNYDNKYHEKEELFSQMKKEKQIVNNFRTKDNTNESKVILVGSSLFNCDFNYVENTSGLVRFVEEDGIFYMLLTLEYYYQVLFRICKDVIKDDSDNIFLSEEQSDILDVIEKSIENNMEFFMKKVVETNFNIRLYKLVLFFYQINVVIKQFLLLKNINDNIYKLLIRFLNRYQTLLKEYANTYFEEDITFYNNQRNFFFDFLLNPRLYKQNEKFNLLANFDSFLDLANQIFQDNLSNEEILTENIFEKIIKFVYILKFRDNNENEQNNLDKNALSYKKLRLKYILLLINFIQSLYTTIKDTDYILNIIYLFSDKLLDYKGDPIVFYYLSLAFFVSNSLSGAKEEFLNTIADIFQENYLKKNNENKIYSISSMLLLNSYCLIFYKNNADKYNQFKEWYSKLSQKKAYIYFENIFSLIFGGVYELDDILDISKNYKESPLDDETIRNGFFEKREKDKNSTKTASLLIQQNIYSTMATFSGYENNLEIVKKNEEVEEDKNNIETQEDKIPIKEKKIIKVNIKVNTEINELEITKIKNNIYQEKYYNDYYCFLDDIKSRCFIYNPKNVLIKRFFAHIFHKALFHCKAFVTIKNKYLNLFPDANIENKQLNYPSKIKNFANVYEPKLFLRKNFSFYDSKYFPITHDYLIKDPPSYEDINEDKKEKFEYLIKKNKSNIDFYNHRYNINDILEEKERYFDCELINEQYTYFGYLILGNNYLYFGTKYDEPIDLWDKNNENINIDYISRFCFSLRDSGNKTSKKKTIIIFYEDIKTIIKRRSFLMYQSFEIFCQNGKSYFFNLYRKESCENAFVIFSAIRDNLPIKDKFELVSENTSKEVKKVISEVKNGYISNYLYLLKLNFYASRTFNDINQYPVFPWLFFDLNKINAILSIEKSSIEKAETTANEPLVNQEDNNDIIDIEGIEMNNAENSNEDLSVRLQLRNFSYPISLQTELKREKYIEKNDTNHGKHYSTSSYILYYLVRSYPFGEAMVQLQNLNKENPNRLLLTMAQSLKLLEQNFENREACPEFFSSFDFYSNLNCIFLGIQDDHTFVDDLRVDKSLIIKSNIYPTYFKYVYLFRKLLNSYLISKFLPNWIDYIFGSKQLEKNRRSLYLFDKHSYEENLKLDKKLNKYYKKNENEEMTNYQIRKKIKGKLNFLNNCGMVPHKILSNRVKLNTYAKIKNLPDEFLEINENIYFDKINDNVLIMYKNQKDSYKAKKILIWNNSNTKNTKIFDKKNIYPCGSIKQLEKIMIEDSDLKIPVYKPYYAMCKFIMFNKIFIATCRYLGNIFKIQNGDYCIDVFCEDFISCITCRKESDLSNNNDVIIYTGLKNGKLIEWFIKENLNDYGKINIKERNNIHCHRGDLICIEIFKNQNVLITAGEDKMLFIRKIYDFELLTAIDLTYCFMNQIIQEKTDIIPTMVKVSELNCLYVLLFNKNTGKSFIRGYNLNGLFFAQSEEDYYMNICFTKNFNLLISRYNQKEIQILNCYDLQEVNFSIDIAKFVGDVEKNSNKKNKKVVNGGDFLVWNYYDCNNHEIILLFKNKIVKGNIKTKEDQINLEYY